MERNCDFCDIELRDDNESTKFPGVCKDCIEKEPLIVDENLPHIS
ncbi:MAG: hypothetical protein JWM44_1239 [Bacilli bacterium]|nr:hypothetical protein [Bacilli bacterium]